MWCNGGMMELDGRAVTTAELAGLGLYNYGHFTSVRIDNGRVRGLSLHLRRLVNDCRTLFGADLDPEAVRKLIRWANGGASEVARVTIYAPDLELGNPGRVVEPHILVTTRRAANHDLPPLRLRSVPYRRELP
jgi:branched-subunit amino acid aminotransferase/4-amino-4-deoxychorismate lyase